MKNNGNQRPTPTAKGRCVFGHWTVGPFIQFTLKESGSKSAVCAGCIIECTKLGLKIAEITPIVAQKLGIVKTSTSPIVDPHTGKPVRN